MKKSIFKAQLFLLGEGGLVRGSHKPSARRNVTLFYFEGLTSIRRPHPKINQNCQSNKLGGFAYLSIYSLYHLPMFFITL